MRLSEASLERLPCSIDRFGYRRDQQGIGIVHLGIGAFHRAHEAWYTDLALEGGDAGWGICGVSLRSNDAATKLNPQNGLYSLTASDGVQSSTRVIGAVCHVLATTTQSGTAAAIAAIASPATRILSLTVTEKGYERGSFGNPLARLEAPPIYPLLAEGLRRRRLAGVPGLTLLSCDNLPANGPLLRASLTNYLDEIDSKTAGWVEQQCTAPSTMVDRIVPAASPGSLELARDLLTLEDQAAILTEPFSQWVIEDDFVQGRPGWDRVGATFTADVRPFEAAKLRMLNGAHSALAYLGLERGYCFVDEAVADPELKLLAAKLMSEAAATIPPRLGQSLDAYASELVRRMSNSTLRHRLDQIAVDGSQKIRQRWLETIAERREHRLESPTVLTALAAWVRFIRGDGGHVDDPLAGHFAALWKSEGAGGIAAALFSDRGTFAKALTPAEQRCLTDEIWTFEVGSKRSTPART